MFSLHGGMTDVHRAQSNGGAASGVVLPLLQQSILLWQVSLGYLILGKRLSPAEVRMCLPVVARALTCAPLHIMAILVHRGGWATRHILNFHAGNQA